MPSRAVDLSAVETNSHPAVVVVLSQKKKSKDIQARGESMSELKKRVEQNRRNGKKGGQATAKKHKNVEDENGETLMERRARAGGNACLMNYGRDFFRSIRALRTA